LVQDEVDNTFIELFQAAPLVAHTPASSDQTVAPACAKA
jgi:hypothetical protein